MQVSRSYSNSLILICQFNFQTAVLYGLPFFCIYSAQPKNIFSHLKLVCILRKRLAIKKQIKYNLKRALLRFNYCIKNIATNFNTKGQIMNKFQLITNEVKKVINGKDRAVVTTLLALLTGGNILIEDIPGVGKTTMAVAFSKALGLEYGRVQFTPDTLPSDITGFAVYNKDTGKFTFNKGAVFCNLFLADELNRTSSRTQAALLEAMEERQVTVEGNTFKLEKPFSVIATQNPTGASGTQLLPDSQIDRFTVRLSMGYPDSDAECKMLLNRSGKNPLNSVNCIVSKNEFLEMQSEVQNVFVSDDMARYIVSLISATRKHPLLSRGASPRATLSLTDMAKAVAFAEGRDYIVPRDVQNIFICTVNHRIILNAKASASKKNSEEILHEILRKTPKPRT